MSFDFDAFCCGGIVAHRWRVDRGPVFAQTISVEAQTMSLNAQRIVCDFDAFCCGIPASSNAGHMGVFYKRLVGQPTNFEGYFVKPSC